MSARSTRSCASAVSQIVTSAWGHKYAEATVNSDTIRDITQTDRVNCHAAQPCDGYRLNWTEKPKTEIRKRMSATKKRKKHANKKYLRARLQRVVCCSEQASTTKIYQIVLNRRPPTYHRHDTSNALMVLETLPKMRSEHFPNRSGVTHPSNTNTCRCT